MEANDVVGRTGTVVVRIKGPSAPGEVRVTAHGAPELLIAYSEDLIERDASVLITNFRGPRTVDVIPWTIDTGGAV